MQFVDKALFTMEKAQGKEPVLEALVPRYVPVDRRAIPEGEEVKLEFWYDFSSPWAFLGWTQLPRLQRIFGQRLKIEMKPFLLGILFREYVSRLCACEVWTDFSPGLAHRTCPWLLCRKLSANTHSSTIRTGAGGGTTLTARMDIMTRTSTSIGRIYSPFAHLQS